MNWIEAWDPHAMCKETPKTQLLFTESCTAFYGLSDSSSGVLSEKKMGGVPGVAMASSSSWSEPSSWMGISLGPT